jgi:hypothetical protein
LGNGRKVSAVSKLGKKNKDSKAANDKKMKQQLDALMRRQAQKKNKK